MFMVSLVMILAVVLLISSFVFAVKSFLISAKVSDNGYKNIVAISFMTIALLCSIVAFLGGFFSINFTDELQHLSNAAPTAETLLLNQINHWNSEIAVAIILGYISLLLSYLMVGSIQKEKAAELNKPKKHWNWDGISNHK